MPLHLFIQYEAIASIARNRHCMKLDWPGQNAKRKTYIGHLKYWSAKTEEINILIEENDKTHDMNWFKVYTINTQSLTSQTLPLQSQINVYTDGSKTDQHSGSGFAIYRGNKLLTTGSRRLPSESTVFQAEILAIRIAMI